MLELWQCYIWADSFPSTSIFKDYYFLGSDRNLRHTVRTSNLTRFSSANYHYTNDPQWSILTDICTIHPLQIAHSHAPLRQIKKTSSNTNQTVIVVTSRSRNVIRTLVTVFGTLIQTDTQREVYFFWHVNAEDMTIGILSPNFTATQLQFFITCCAAVVNFICSLQCLLTCYTHFEFCIALTHYRPPFLCKA